MSMRRLLRPRLTRVSSAGFSLAASIAFSIFATECLIAMIIMLGKRVPDRVITFEALESSTARS